MSHLVEAVDCRRAFSVGDALKDGAAAPKVVGPSEKGVVGLGQIDEADELPSKGVLDLDARDGIVVEAVSSVSHCRSHLGVVICHTRAQRGAGEVR